MMWKFFCFAKSVGVKTNLWVIVMAEVLGVNVAKIFLSCKLCYKDEVCPNCLFLSDAFCSKIANCFKNLSPWLLKPPLFTPSKPPISTAKPYPYCFWDFRQACPFCSFLVRWGCGFVRQALTARPLRCLAMPLWAILLNSSGRLWRIRSLCLCLANGWGNAERGYYLVRFWW